MDPHRRARAELGRAGLLTVAAGACQLRVPRRQFLPWRKAASSQARRGVTTRRWPPCAMLLARASPPPNSPDRRPAATKKPTGTPYWETVP